MGVTYDNAEDAQEQGSACTFALDIDFQLPNFPPIPSLPSLPSLDIGIELPTIDLTCPYD